MKALVIDDEEDMRLVVAMSLGELGGMEVIEAPGAAEGVRRAREETPDVILLDLVMPGIDGEAALRALQDDPATRAIPVILLTGAGMAGDAGRLRSDGALGVIHKPFDPLTLAGEVARLLGRPSPSDF